MARITKGMRSKPRRKAWKPFWRRFRVLEGPVEFPKGFEHFEQGREMGFLTLSRFRIVLELIIFCTNLSWQYGRWLSMFAAIIVLVSDEFSL